MATARIYLQTEYGIRYAPPSPLTAQEEMEMVEAVLRQQGPEVTLRIARLLISRRAVSPNRPFLPVVWVEEEVKEEMRREAGITSTPSGDADGPF